MSDGAMLSGGDAYMTGRDAGKQRRGWASLVLALRDLVREGCLVTLGVRPRHDVASREWWTLTWEYQSTEGHLPERHTVEAQYLDVLLRRAAGRLNDLEARPWPSA